MRQQEQLMDIVSWSSPAFRPRPRTIFRDALAGFTIVSSASCVNEVTRIRAGQNPNAGPRLHTVLY
jgi:hypothetical protein